MPYFNAHVGKGPYGELLDSRFGGPRERLRAVYEEALARLDGPPDMSLGDVVERHAGGEGVATPLAEIGPDDVAHFKEHWLNHADAGQVLRQAYRQAITLASRGDVRPIETFFVTIPGEHFEAYVSESERQITVLACVPGAVARRNAGGTETTHLWQIKTDADASGKEVAGTTERGVPVVVRQLGGRARGA